MSAGKYRHRVTIRRNEKTRNTSGDYVDNWEDVARLWARIEGLNGREVMLANALQGISSYKLTIRYRDPLSIKQSDQITLPGDIKVNVQSVSDVTGRREELVILADTSSVQREAS